jgi:hypothetical protein
MVAVYSDKDYKSLKCSMYPARKRETRDKRNHYNFFITQSGVFSFWEKKLMKCIQNTLIEDFL